MNGTRLTGGIIICLILFSFSLPSQTHAQNIDSLWNVWVMKRGGCLVGRQYVRDGRIGGEGSVFASKRNGSVIKSRVSQFSVPFFDLPESELVPFLIGKMASTDSTHIHTCPFFTAIEGEVAVYSLQVVSMMNWYDLPGFTPYKNRETEGSTENHQVWLQAIIRSPEKLAMMQEQWRNAWESNK